mmetsp:Transcript_52232/g.131125  ORF Transcript_52232/g.131125 Transcript_52232/m.131125 type:complete len:272 (-) Transcript_52232:622-1437(-)
MMGMPVAGEWDEIASHEEEGRHSSGAWLQICRGRTGAGSTRAGVAKFARLTVGPVRHTLTLLSSLPVTARPEECMMRHHTPLVCPFSAMTVAPLSDRARTFFCWHEHANRRPCAYSRELTCLRSPSITRRQVPTRLHRRMVRSALPLYSVSALTVSVSTAAVWPSNTCTHRPDGSHARMVLSTDALYISPKNGWRAPIQSLCPLSTLMHVPAEFHTRMVLSHEPVYKYPPKECSARTLLEWPCRMARISPPSPQHRTVLSHDPENSTPPRG